MGAQNDDPKPWWNKSLVIIYEARGEHRTLNSDEGGQVNAEILLRADAQQCSVSS